VAMKKGRPGVLLTVLAPPATGPILRRVWWRHGTTLGVREQEQRRWCLPRQSEVVDTPLGPVRIKWACLPDGRRRVKPEHDDLVALARRHDSSLEQVRSLVMQAIDATDRREPTP